MSAYHYGLLAYGINLGHTEDAGIEEVGRFGSPDLPWMQRDEEGDTTEDLGDAIIRRLYELIPEAPAKEEPYQMEDLVEQHYGVKVLVHGWTYESNQPAWVLSTFHYTVDGGDVCPVDPYELIQTAALKDWNARLTAVIHALGITPKEPESRWLLLAHR